MAGSINKVILVGNLGRDPEVRFNTEGEKIVTLSIATNEYWKNKASGERSNHTEWHRVVVFNDKLAEVCDKYLKKGSKIYLEGKLQTRQWIDQKGHKRYSTEVILGKYRGEITLLDSHNGDGSEEHNMSEDNAVFGSREASRSDTELLISGGGIPLNDEVPF